MENQNVEAEEHRKFESEKSTFLLNTNTTCFLCLNYTFPDQISDESFIKLENRESELHQNNCSLLSICRYLKIDFKELIGNSGYDKISNISVKLCKKCSIVASKLSDLCRELEVLKMKADHCLQDFQDELEDSEMDIVRAQRFWKMQLKNFEDFHVELALMLRKKMKKQCDIKLNSMLPKVVIFERKEEANIRIRNTPNGQTTADPVSFQNHLVSETAEVAEQDFENESDPELLSEDGSEEEVKFVENGIRVANTTPHWRPRSKYGTGGQLCTLCKPASKMKKSVLQGHKIRVHMEVLMINYKLRNISLKDFKTYCDHVFKVETLASLKGITNFQCPFCPIKYRTDTSQRVHLFQQHKKLLSKKIIELQKSSTVEEIQSIKLPSLGAASGETWNCNDCGKAFNCKRNCIKHNRRSCKVKIKANQRKLIEIEIRTGKDSILIDNNDDDQEHPNLKREDEDEFENGIGENDDLQQEQIMDVDIVKDGFVVKMEHCNDDVEAILPAILENDPLNS